ncbi:hypothetical protein AB0F72_09460 [Actinoplanes sp. NPDC023936]|uniref:hypothetical protein n=1 Tax=Actinoplanes sp. NPDC023936 TaxID=3154910 RepID=UPI0033E1707C
MTAALLAGWAGLLLSLLVRTGWAYRRGLLAGQRQAELTHGWHQHVPGDPNPSEVPKPRRRSPNRQVKREPAPPPRPVFHDR